MKNARNSAQMPQYHMKKIYWCNRTRLASAHPDYLVSTYMYWNDFFYVLFLHYFWDSRSLWCELVLFIMCIVYVHTILYASRTPTKLYECICRLNAKQRHTSCVVSKISKDLLPKAILNFLYTTTVYVVRKEGKWPNFVSFVCCVSFCHTVVFT